MTLDQLWTDDIAAYLAALERGDRSAALGQVRALRGEGHDVVTLIQRLLAPAQLRVGELWVSDEWSVAFYTQMFREHPDVRPMFTTDLAVQRAKFVAEIGSLLELVGDLDQFEDRAARLGADHVGYGVRAAHYRASRDALLGSVEVLLGDDATPEVLAAWRAVHDLVAEAMLTRRSYSA